MEATLIEKCCEAYDEGVTSFNKYLNSPMFSGENAKALNTFMEKQEQLGKLLLGLKDMA